MSITEIRNYTPDDLSSIHEIAQRAAEHDQVDHQSTLEGIPSLDQLAESFGDGNNNDVLVGVDSGGNIVGYGQIKWWQEEDGSIVYVHSGVVDPSERNNGHGSSIVDSLESKIRDLATTHDRDVPKFIGANGSETNDSKLDMLARRGYEVVHSMVEMEFVDPGKLPSLELPGGFTLKNSATSEEKRKVYDAHRLANEGAFGMPQKSEVDYNEFIEDNPDSSKWRVVWDGDNVAGYVISQKREDGSAEIMEVGVVPEYRRQGLAGFLMAESINSLQSEGIELIRLHTDADGKMGGRQLYENIGFKALKEHHRYRKPL